jgi:HK97 family phage portal protein
MAKWKFFNFLGEEVDAKEIDPIASDTLNQLAFKELALYIGISYIANTLSKCEFKVYEKGEEAKNMLYYMLNVSPNPNQNSSQFIHQFIERLYYDGHALIVPHNGHIYCADDFDIEDDNPLKEAVFHNVAFNCHQARKKYKANEVFYLRLDDKKVKKLIDSLYTQYGTVIAQALSAYKRTNGAKYKYILDSYTAGDKTFQKVYEEVLKEQLKSFVEHDNGVFPQYKGTNLEKFSHGTVKDTSDITAMRKEIFEVVAQALKIPLSMMNGNITNMNEIVKVFLTICIDPLGDMIGEEFTRKYFTFEEWKNGNKVKVDTSCINHIDILEVGDEISKAIGSGVVNIDDLRTRLDMPELQTEFSKTHFITKNYDRAENMLKSDMTEGGE